MSKFEVIACAGLLLRAAVGALLGIMEVIDQEDGWIHLRRRITYGSRH